MLTFNSDISFRGNVTIIRTYAITLRRGSLDFKQNILLRRITQLQRCGYCSFKGACKIKCSLV